VYADITLGTIAFDTPNIVAVFVTDAPAKHAPIISPLAKWDKPHLFEHYRVQTHGIRIFSVANTNSVPEFFFYYYYYFLFFSGIGLSPLGTAATSGLLYKPQMIDEGDCGAIGGMKFGRGNRSTNS
jgi:hypothetical protein